MSEKLEELRKRALAHQFRGSAEAPELAHALVSLAEEEAGAESLTVFDALDILARSYLERRDGPRAIRFYLQALRLGDAIRAPAEQRAVTSSSLAYAHLLRGDLEPAVEEAERALERAASVTGAPLAKVLGQAAAVLAAAKQHERAFAMYGRADAVLEPLDEGEGDVALEACVDRLVANLNRARTALDLARGFDAEASLFAALGRLERMRKLRLTPPTTYVETLRSAWAALQAAPGAAVSEEARAAFEVRSTALSAALDPPRDL